MMAGILCAIYTCLHTPRYGFPNLRRKIITGEIDNTTMVSPPGPVCHPWTHERAARIALPMPPNTRRSGGRVRVWQSWTTQRLSAQPMPIAPRQRGGRLFRIVSLLEAHAHSALEKILLKATRSAKPLPDAAPELETDLHTLLALCRQVRRFQQGRSLDLGPSTPDWTPAVPPRSHAARVVQQKQSVHGDTKRLFSSAAVCAQGKQSIGGSEAFPCGSSVSTSASALRSAPHRSCSNCSCRQRRVETKQNRLPRGPYLGICGSGREQLRWHRLDRGFPRLFRS